MMHNTEHFYFPGSRNLKQLVKITKSYVLIQLRRDLLRLGWQPAESKQFHSGIHMSQAFPNPVLKFKLIMQFFLKKLNKYDIHA